MDNTINQPDSVATQLRTRNALPVKAAVLLNKHNPYLVQLENHVKSLVTEKEIRDYLERLYFHLNEKNLDATLTWKQKKERAKPWVDDLLSGSQKSIGNKEWCLKIGYGTCVQSLRNWARFCGHKDSRNDTLRDLANCINAQRQLVASIEDTIAPIQLDDFLDCTDSYDFGAKLQLNVHQVQFMADEYHWSAPLPGFGYYLNDTDAKTYQNHEGVYCVFHRAPTAPHLILQSTLRIRYALSGTRGINIIRCKLHIPCVPDDVHGTTSYFAYDGRVTHRANGFHYWHFEQNKQGAPGKPDFVNLTTTDIKNARCTGILSSVWDSDTIFPYAAKAVIIRQLFPKHNLEDANFLRDFMRQRIAIHESDQALQHTLQQQTQQGALNIKPDGIEFICRKLKGDNVLC